MSDNFKKHFLSSNSTHQIALQKYVAYEGSKLAGSISSQLNSQHRATVLRNRFVLSCHVQVILVCAQQVIALRGHQEGKESNNRGNFLEILDLFKIKCSELETGMQEIPGNAQYTHHSIQNELITISKSLILHMISEEVKKNVECYSIIADETKDEGGIEQLSVCIRYVDDASIRERFIGFIDLENFDADSLTQNILTLLNDAGLCITNCVAQSYDGANVMSGDVSGVHTRIQDLIGEIFPYVNCYAHRLNLVLVDCCGRISEVRDLLGLLQSIYVFQFNSSLRSKYFEDSQRLIQQEVIKMPQSCETRWYSKKKGLQYFRTRLDAVVIALGEIIQHGKPEEVVQCNGYLHHLKSFRTIFMLVIIDEVLGQTNALSEYLQFPELVYTRAVKLSKSTIEALRNMRTDAKFDECWKESSHLADSIFVTAPSQDQLIDTRRRKIPSKRLAKYLILNTTGSRATVTPTVFHHLRGIYFRVIDNFIQEMNRRLLKNDNTLERLDASVPNNETFLDTEMVVYFCNSFKRFRINEEALKSQLQIAKNLLRAENVKKKRLSATTTCST